MSSASVHPSLFASEFPLSSLCVLKPLEEMEVKLGEDVVIIEVKDPKMMAARDVFVTPGVVIDGVKVSMGRIPDVKEIRGWIEERLEKR